MGITYYYCMECECCYLNEYCPYRNHHYIYAYKCDNPTLQFIDFLKSKNLFEEFLNTLPTFGDPNFEYGYITEYYEFLADEEKYKSHHWKECKYYDRQEYWDRD